MTLRKRAGEALLRMGLRFTGTNPIGEGASPYRTQNRDRAIGYSIAPQQTRQVWELHRAREESRQLELSSPMWRAAVHWARVQVVGAEAARLHFYRIRKDDRERLKPACEWLREQWDAFQGMPIGARGENLHQQMAQVLYHRMVDGDCFVIPYREEGRWFYQLYPGDALAETSHIPAVGRPDNPQRALGIDVDGRGRPVTYYFGHGARYGSLGYVSYTNSLDVQPFPAARVWHIRDRSGNTALIRGWPWCTAALDDIARLDDFYSAFVRAAIARASVWVSVERDPEYTSLTHPGESGMSALEAAAADALTTRAGGAGPESVDESVKPYQEQKANAGDLLVFEPGYKTNRIDTGAPSPQENMTVTNLEHRACAALRISPATLLAELKAVSFSAGQLNAAQERATVEELQLDLTTQYVGRVWFNFFGGRWIELLKRFPEVTPEDRAALTWPKHMLRRYQVLDKAKMIPGILAAFERGALTYAEMRAELGMSGADADAIIAQWLEDREALKPGMSDKMADLVNKAGGNAGPKDDDDDDDDEEDEEEDEEEDDDA